MSRSPRTALTVLEPGALTTVQDLGRRGLRGLGIGPSGACDREAHRLANALVGNPAECATLEVTLGGLAVRAETTLTLALAGARSPSVPHLAPMTLRAGDVLRLEAPTAGLRTYVAVRGGIPVEPVLESRSTDMLSGLGPPPLSTGDRLPVGAPTGPMPGVDVAPVREPTDEPLTVKVRPGPRRDWFTQASWPLLTGQDYAVSSKSNRVGLRLEGQPLERVREGELISEGMLPGAIQVPPAGTPVVFLADCPVTGGYPVVAYVADCDLDALGQARPGQVVRFCEGGAT